MVRTGTAYLWNYKLETHHYCGWLRKLWPGSQNMSMSRAQVSGPHFLDFLTLSRPPWTICKTWEGIYVTVGNAYWAHSFYIYRTLSDTVWGEKRESSQFLFLKNVFPLLFKSFSVPTLAMHSFVLLKEWIQYLFTAYFKGESQLHKIKLRKIRVLCPNVQKEKAFSKAINAALYNISGPSSF